MTDLQAEFHERLRACRADRPVRRRRPQDGEHPAPDRPLGDPTIARDFSCIVLTARHELLTAADSLPIHVLRGPEVMSRTMTQNHPVLRRGDAFLHNSPYHGCTHPADHSILVPVIDDEGVHRFTVLAKGHQADCGNALPTTYMGAAKDVYAEGALIFPAVRIQSNYQHEMDIVRMCQMRIRVPDAMVGRLSRHARRRAGRRARNTGARARNRLGEARGLRARMVRLQREAHVRGDSGACRQGV